MTKIFDIHEGQLRLFPVTERKIVDWHRKRNIRKLIKALRDTDLEIDVRALAAIGLGKLKNRRALKPLLKCMESNDTYMQRNCIIALGELGLPEALEPLIRAASSSESMIRQKALEALGPVGGENARELLISALSDPDVDTRASALIGISKSNLGDRIDILLHHLKDPDKFIRATAAQCLGRMRDPSTIKPMLESFEIGREKNYAILYALGCFDSKTMGEYREAFEDLKAKESQALRSMGFEVEDEFEKKLSL